MRSCNNCVYNTSNKYSCLALKERIKTNCFAWADKDTARQRLNDIKNYKTSGLSYYDCRNESIFEKELKALLEV